HGAQLRSRRPRRALLEPAAPASGEPRLVDTDLSGRLAAEVEARRAFLAAPQVADGAAIHRQGGGQLKLIDAVAQRGADVAKYSGLQRSPLPLPAEQCLPQS